MAREFFENLPNQTTPLTAPRLNRLLDGDEAMGNIVVDSIRGKNLLNLNQCTFENCILNSNNSVKSNITDSYFCSIKFSYLNDFILKNKGKSITFSINESIENRKLSIVILGTRTGGSTYQEIDTTTGTRYVSGTIADDFTNITQVELRFNRSTSTFTDTSTTRTNFMLELNTTTPTDYAPYQNLKSYLNNIILNDEWLYAVRVGGSGWNILIPFQNPNKKTPVINITSADYYSSGWISITPTNISVGSYNQTTVMLVVPSSDIASGNNVTALVKIKGTISITD